MAIEFTVEVHIARPPADVFAVAGDPARLPEWQPLVVATERLNGGSGPLREGARIRETREVRGRRVEQVVEVATYDPPRRFDLRIVEGPFPVHGDFLFEPSAGGTRVRLRAHGGLPGAKRLLEPAFALLGRREMRRQLAALKAVVEGR
jgi:uncharacterized protein YndB with AHSA1/START domain